MKEIKNLLIVNSPLILLNALEAISYFKLKNILKKLDQCQYNFI